MTRIKRVPQIDSEDEDLKALADLLAKIRGRRVGPEATYEARRRAAASVMAEAMWLDEEREMQALVTTAERIEVDGVAYAKLKQPSSATYHGVWGTHLIREPLYRQEGVRNGPTIKPIEARLGTVADHVMPDAARIMGFLAAFMTSDEIEQLLQEMGFRPPSRAFIEKRVKIMAGEIENEAADLEEAARVAEADRPEAIQVAAVSCGLDRMAVRMDEPLPEGKTPPDKPPRKKPYERTPPRPAEHNWRMAWVASMTEYDADGNAIRTRRYGTDAGGDGSALAERVIADVKVSLERAPGIPVICVQDAAKDLRKLPKGLSAEMSDEDLALLPSKLVGVGARPVEFHHLTDFQHLMGYLGAVVRTCEPEGDPHHMEQWYRSQLLTDDNAIDRILRNLRRRKIPDENEAGLKAVAKAVKYIAKRRGSMRYATLHKRNLPVGSGATESTCALFQLRVKRPGTAWKVFGLRGIMTIRGLALSDRWDAAWKRYAASKRRDVKLPCAA